VERVLLTTEGRAKAWAKKAKSQKSREGGNRGSQGVFGATQGNQRPVKGTRKRNDFPTPKGKETSAPQYEDRGEGEKKGAKISEKKVGRRRAKNWLEGGAVIRKDGKESLILGYLGRVNEKTKVSLKNGKGASITPSIGGHSHNFSRSLLKTK